MQAIAQSGSSSPRQPCPQVPAVMRASPLSTNRQSVAFSQTPSPSVSHSTLLGAPPAAPPAPELPAALSLPPLPAELEPPEPPPPSSSSPQPASSIVTNNPPSAIWRMFRISSIRTL